MTHLDNQARALLALAFPGHWQQGPVAGPVEAKALLKALKSNKIPLLSLTTAGLELVPDFRDSRELAQALEGARRDFTHYRREFAEISAALDGQGVPQILMKSAGPFPYESDNFDILIPHGRRREVDRALRPLGFVPQRHYRENWKFIYKRFRDGRLLSIAHLHEEVSWGVEPFLDREGLWERAQPSPEDPAFLVPAPEDSFLITMAHGVYENDRIKLGDLLKVQSAFRRAGGKLDWAAMEQTARKLGWLDGHRWILRALHDLEHALWGASLFDAALAQGQLRMAPPDAVTRRVAAARRFPVPLGRRFSKTLFLRKLLRANPLSAIPAQLAGFTRDAVEALWPLPLHGPLVVAVSGMDGAGKSTAIRELERLCEELELRHEVLWLRAGNSDLMQAVNRGLRRLLGPWLRRATNDESREAGPAAAPRPERIIRSPGLARLWYWVALGELLLRARLQLRWGRLRRRVVICDRYLADSLVDLAIRCGRREGLDSLASRLPACAFPRPDLTLVLLADAATAHGRKEQEFTLEQMELRARLYGEVARIEGAVVIDSTQGKEATFRRLHEAFLARYAPPPA